MIVCGVDLSLASTGLTRIHSDGRVEVARYRTKPTDPSPEARSLRLRRITATVTRACAGADLVVIEGPAYASDVGKMWDRAGCWWLVVARLTGTGIPVVEVPPSVVKTYATGKGNAPKDQVLAAMIRRYPDVPITGNDEADALALACMGAHHLGFPITELPQTHTRALAAIRHWPTLTEQEQQHG